MASFERIGRGDWRLAACFDLSFAATAMAAAGTEAEIDERAAALLSRLTLDAKIGHAHPIQPVGDRLLHS
jgi:hypothetical protein